MKKPRLKKENLHCWWIIFGLNRIINFTQLDLKKDYFESTNGKCFGLPITPWLEIRPSLGKTFLFACENPTIPFRIPSGLKSQYQTRKMILNVRRIKFFFATDDNLCCSFERLQIFLSNDIFYQLTMLWSAFKCQLVFCCRFYYHRQGTCASEQSRPI